MVIRFANPAGIDFPYLLSMLHDSWMTRANTLVVPGGKMELAMQLIFTPMILRLMERRASALGPPKKRRRADHDDERCATGQPRVTAMRQRAARAGHRRRAGRQLNHPACPWAWPTSPRRCGATTSSTIRPTRSGPTATASCSPTATARCCSTRCCISRLRAADGRVEALPPAALAHARPPEHGLTPGVETTTGPLSQGISNAVGMALAEKLLAAEFNKPGHTVIDHRTWVFLGDGCLMEGISHEACSLAGTWRLNKLVAFYDDNGISIDGDVKGWFGDDTPARFEAYGWTVIRNVDGHDRLALDAAIEAAKSASQPVLICCRTQIGHGSPNRAGTAKAHGEALAPRRSR